ncbi:MAG: DUF4249 domain-containing protein [Bacteroidales bacterium]|nr:DUF4249 domain-containing protein [Bacteroidales bacterium]
MKPHYLLYPILALLAGACTTPLDFQVDQKPEVLVLNAMLTTRESGHEVFLSRGLVNEVLPMPDARLSCYINGTLAAEGNYVPSYENSYASLYTFDADIRPGDEVRLVASCGTLEASATAKAPQPAKLVAVDTSSIAESPYKAYGFSAGFFSDETPRALRCRLSLQDRPDEVNWYRLNVSSDAVIERTDGGTEHLSEAVRFGYSLDPILNDGNITQEDGSTLEDLISLLGGRSSNRFCTFTDRTFSDRTAEAELHISENRLFLTQYINKEMETLSGLHLHFDLLTISYEEYVQMAMLEKFRKTGSDWNPLTEPLHFPDNVEGGQGFFSIASASSLSLDIPVAD